MPKSGWIVALLPLVALSMTLGAQSPNDWSRVKRFFRQQVSDAGIVGASLMIVREGKIEAEQYVADQEEATRRPVDRDTIYHWASITKTFTGIAIMQLRGTPPRHRSDRTQRQPERVSLPPLSSPPLADGVRRGVQHRRVVQVARQAQDYS